MNTQNENGYSPIGDYGVIGNRHTAALINSHGSLDWLCWPRFDSPSLFASLLDPRTGGSWTIHPTSSYRSGHRYHGETTILETEFVGPEGKAMLIDFMDMTGMRHGIEKKPPGRLVRLVRCLEGEMEVENRIQPRPNYARDEPEVRVSGGRVGVGPFVLTGPVGWRYDDRTGTLTSSYDLQEDDELTFTLDAPGPGSVMAFSSASALKATIAYWQKWANKCSYEGPYRNEVVRSALTLQMMTYAPSGAIVAAPTTSLPEMIGGEMNWDYRFTWIRDGSFSLYALLLSGYLDDEQAFIRWLKDLKGTELKILYPITSDGNTAERTLDHLSGYMGSRPVRIGNDAAGQVQLDIYGELASELYFAWRIGLLPLQEDGHRVRAIMNWICEHWREPDNGLWEVRGGVRHFVYGKAMLWYALKCGVEAFEELDIEGEVERWRRERDAIHADVMANGWSGKLNAFKQSYEDETLDAANLMLPTISFIDGKDPRMLSTIDATLENLVVNGLCYRYNDAPVGVSGKEATFTLCTFWLINALVLAGRVDEGRKMLDEVLARASPLGLFAEEIEPTTGAQIGNYPQAFSHLGIINSAVTLAHVGHVGKVSQQNARRAHLTNYARSSLETEVLNRLRQQVAAGAHMYKWGGHTDK
jgi:GH15 family glucan-1,4-alpha-glucosidase